MLRNLIERMSVRASMDGKRISSNEKLKNGMIIKPMDIKLSSHTGKKIFLICKNIETTIIKRNIKFT
ncbi:hypothetical protein TdN_06680 [Thermodesulfovibrio sp. TK110]